MRATALRSVDNGVGLADTKDALRIERHTHHSPLQPGYVAEGKLHKSSRVRYCPTHHTATGIDKNPRKRARPPRTGSPASR